MLLVLLGLVICAIVGRSILSPRASERRVRYWSANSEEWISGGIPEEVAASRQRLDDALSELRAEARHAAPTNSLGPESIQFTGDATPTLLRALHYPI